MIRSLLCQVECGGGIEQQFYPTRMRTKGLRHLRSRGLTRVQSLEHPQFETGQQNLGLPVSLGHLPQLLALF
jgi:hypothetical protein